MKFPRLILPCPALSVREGQDGVRSAERKNAQCLLVGGSLAQSNLFRCAGSMVPFWPWEVWIYSLVLAYRMVGQQICIRNTKCW
jgi:hypothetical protein